MELTHVKVSLALTLKTFIRQFVSNTVVIILLNSKSFSFGVLNREIAEKSLLKIFESYDEQWRFVAADGDTNIVEFFYK